MWGEGRTGGGERDTGEQVGRALKRENENLVEGTCPKHVSQTLKRWGKRYGEGGGERERERQREERTTDTFGKRKPFSEPSDPTMSQNQAWGHAVGSLGDRLKKVWKHRLEDLLGNFARQLC